MKHMKHTYRISSTEIIFRYNGNRYYFANMLVYRTSLFHPDAFKQEVPRLQRLHLCKMRVPEDDVKIEHYLRHENKGSENNALSSCEALRHL